MTVDASITPYKECYVWQSAGEPLSPFKVSEQMENRKYFDWIMKNVDRDPKVKQYTKNHPQTGQETTMYHLNHMVRIAGQYENMDDARVAINHVKKTPKSGASLTSDTEGSQVQLFGDYLKGFTQVFNGDQRLISAEDFFTKVFPCLRPGAQDQVYLPALYRDHIRFNGQLVANGSSVAVDLTNNNYENIASASTSTRTMLESNLITTEEEVADRVPERMQQTRTVPPSQLSQLPANQIERGERFGNLENPWVVPTTWEQQQEMIRYQINKGRELDFQHRMKQKQIEMELRIKEKRDAAQIKGDIEERSHRLMRETFDHKQQARTNSSTRSRSRVIATDTATASRSGAVYDPTRCLIQPDWDVKNPASVMQAMAIVIDYCFESSPRATEAVTCDSFHFALVNVLRNNSLHFETFEGDTNIEDGQHSWRQKENITRAKELIYTAKINFPKSNIKEVTGAWDFFKRDAISNKRLAMQYVKPRLDRIRSLSTA